MSFEKDIVGSLPLADAASFFLKLKKVADAEPYAPPDETGALEGEFNVPAEQAMQLMSAMVENEFKTMLAYKVYAESLRGPEHFAVSKEFEEHAENELEHAEWLLRRLSVLGGPVQLGDIPPPPPSTLVEEIVPTLIRMEQEGIEKWRMLRQMVGEDNPSRGAIDEFLVREQHHLDELWQMMPHTANQPVLQPNARTLPAAAPQEQPQADATPPVNAPDQSGMSPPAATEKQSAARIERFHPGTLNYHGDAVKMALLHGNARGTIVVPNNSLDGEKIASMKLGAAYQRVMRKKATGNFDQPGEATSAMDDLIKSAGMKMREKLAGIGGGYDWKPMNAIPNTAGDPEASTAAPTTIQVNLPQPGQYAGKENNTVSSAAPILAPKAKATGGAGGGDEMGMGNLDFGKDGAAKVALKEDLQKGFSRGEANVASRARATSGQRGELFGDVIGRLLGGAGGLYAGKPGGHLPAIAGGALGQSLGGRVGKAFGREVDAKRVRKALEKRGFDDTMNYLAQEQAAEQAQNQNEAQFYRDRTRQTQETQQQLQKSLQAAQSDAEAQKAQLAQLQQQMQEQSTMSSDATTKALMQTVQANNEALQSRQLANDSSLALDKLKQTLREIAGDAGGGVNTGMGGAGGEPTSSPDQQGPAGQAPSAGSAPNAAPPAGESTQQAPMESPDSSATGQPAFQAGQNDMNRPQTGDQFKSAAAAFDSLVSAAKQRAPYALAGGAAALGAHALGARGTGKLREEVAAHKAPGSFGEAMSQAAQKARLAYGEVAENHPVASGTLAALGGATMGATAGPGLGKKLHQLPTDLKDIFSRSA